MLFSISSSQHGSEQFSDPAARCGWTLQHGSFRRCHPESRSNKLWCAQDQKCKSTIWDDGPDIVSRPADLHIPQLRDLSIHVPVFSDRPALCSLILQIPYDVTRSEIVQFLGRSPNIIENHTMGCTVHIIMERPTSKTMDCFVEFQTVNSVYDQIRRHDNLVQSGRHPKLGSRHVHVDVSDQNELLAEMFPRAKSIIWENGSPVVITNDDPYSTGFKGFFTREEMVGLVRHAECPQRVRAFQDDTFSERDKRTDF
jgi:hypothetical protein